MSEFKLYELTEIYNNLVDLDMEEGELKIHLDNISEQIETKAENIAKLIKTLSGQADVIGAEIERLSAKKKSLENRATYMKQYLQSAMLAIDIKKIETPLFKFNIQKNAPGLEITDEKNIPDDFYVIERKLSKRELLNAMKDGVEIEGVTLKQTESLRIR